jgi:tRNA pseudouridine synthase 10
MNLLEKATQMLTAHTLCNHCLGRQFALLGSGLENESRGQAIKLLLTLLGHQMLLAEDRAGTALLKKIAAHDSFKASRAVLKRFRKRLPAVKACYLCDDSFAKIHTLTENVYARLKRYEFTTFLVGVELPLAVAEREDEFKARFEVAHGESLKSQFSRDFGKTLCELTGKEVDFQTPDLVVLVNPLTSRFRLQINPLFVAGRYRKLVRGIPQSRWLCRECRGKGCKSCEGTGRKYRDSVEEYVGVPIMKAAHGKEIALHGSGREDVDARMLGTGRPFVLEVKEPKKRFLDLRKLEQAIGESARGRVEVRNLRFVGKEMVRRLKKAEASEKTYRATMKFSRDVSDKELEQVGKLLSRSTVHQQTPLRVLHRRANLMREKYIYEAKIKRLTRDHAEMRVHCQGGLYIKELITGDEGRTVPSVTGILGVKAKPTQLDVLSVVAGEDT